MKKKKKPKLVETENRLVVARCRGKWATWVKVVKRYEPRIIR